MKEWFMSTVDTSYPALASPHCAKGEAVVKVAGANRRGSAAFGTNVLGTWGQKGQRVTVWMAEPPWYWCQDLGTGLGGWTHADVLTVGELQP